MGTARELLDELKVLRKGKALAAPTLTRRVGPALRALCRVGDDDVTTVRHKVTEALAALSGQLPSDLAAAVSAALGLDGDARHALLRDRVRWLADREHRDERTIRRRMDEGLRLLADIAGWETARADGGTGD